MSRGFGGLLAGLTALALVPASALAVGGRAPAYLPDPSCAPVDRETDDAEHAFHAPAAHVIKVIYAHSSDSPNQLAETYPALAQGVRDMTEYLYLESGERKSIRFDLGTEHGLDCVDVQRVDLPNPAAYYDPDNVSAARAKVVADLQSRLGPQGGERNYLVFADGVPNNFRTANSFPFFNDDSTEGASWQKGGFYSVIFDGDFTFGLAVAFGRVGAHELFHDFGAVQQSAPHHGGGAHCTEQEDLMCDSAFGGPQLCDFRSYPTLPWNVVNPIDCGRDDYFNPEPPPGSYLATHWNTYNSPFLCAVGTCVPDNVEPSTSVKGPTKTDDRTPKFKLRSDEAGSGFRCRIDKGNPRVCETPFVTRKLGLGKHRLEAAAVDAAGNVDATPYVHRFRVVDGK